MSETHKARMKLRLLDQHTRQRTYPYVDKSKYKSDGTFTEYYKRTHPEETQDAQVS